MSKTTLFAMLLVIAVVALFAKGPSSPTPVAQGRFLLYNMDYSVATPTVTVKETAVFRIDTQTGDTKEYLSMIRPDGKPVSQWVDITPTSSSPTAPPKP